METTPSTPELIYLYLDGETTPVQETVLFESLAANSELQAEFREAITLRDAFAADRIEQPPVAVTNAVFQRVGITSPFVGAGATVAGFGIVLAGLTKRFAAPALSAVSGGILTLAALWLSGAFHTVADTANTPKNEAVAPLPAANRTDDINSVALTTPPPPLAVAPVYKVQNISQRRAKIGNSPGARQNQYVSTAAFASEESSPPLKITPTTEPDALQSAMSAAPVRLSTTMHRDIPRATPVIASVSEEFSGTPTSEISIQARSIATFGGSGGTTPAQMPTNLLLNNTAIGVFYQLDERNSLGIEAGAESFEHYIFSDGAPELRRQIIWGGLVWRHNFTDRQTWGGFQPYSALTGGFTEAGTMARGVIGLSYMPDERILIAGGIEGSAFFYANASGRFASQKIGLTYSLHIRL